MTKPDIWLGDTWMAKSNYIRVIPRDLFNEADLLKCLGRLSLMVHDGHIRWLSQDHNGQSFDVAQDMDGRIRCTNVSFSAAGAELNLVRPLNCRRSYGLWCEEADDWVFNEDGSVSDGFGALGNTIDDT